MPQLSPHHRRSTVLDTGLIYRYFLRFPNRKFLRLNKFRGLSLEEKLFTKKGFVQESKSFKTESAFEYTLNMKNAQ